MAIIQDAELEAGFQVMIRWYVSSSQRYPADENEYYTTFFNVIEPNQAFELIDSRFDEDAVRAKESAGGEDDPLEFIIRDICYVKTLTPQFVAFHYTYPGYIFRTFTTVDAAIGATTLTVQDVSDLAANVFIQIGPQQGDVYQIDSITNTAGVGSDIITLKSALTKPFLAGTSVNEDDGTAVPNYPDSMAATGISRILSHENPDDTSTDPLEANTPLYYDTGETVLRYYYTNSLEVPFNGARGLGETVDREPITYNGNQYVARWWAISDIDEGPATRACLIDNQGFVVIDQFGIEACRTGDQGFDLNLSYRESSETAACTALVNSDTSLYFSDHPLFTGELSDAADPTSYITGTGAENIAFPDTSSPPAGYYAGEATTGGITDNFVKFWDGSMFLQGIVDEGLWDNCPQPLGEFVVGTLFSTEINLICNTNTGQTLNLYFTGTSFTANNVTAIYTDPYGPASDAPSLLGSTYLRVGSSTFLWDGTNLTNVTGAGVTCSEYCGDPSALNTQSNPGNNAVRNDDLCSYASGVCTDTNANNTQTASPPNTFSDPGACTYDQYTASFDVTNQLVGDESLYTINSGSQTENNGQDFDITLSVSLASGSAWEGDAFDSVNETGTFDGQDETFPVTITGTIIDTTAMPGCNTMGAVNIDPGSDGTGECFFSLGDFYTGNSDSSVCLTSMQGLSQTVVLVSSDDDDKVREWDPVTKSTIQGAEGWYSDGTSFHRYSNGSLVSSGTCPTTSLNGITVTRVSTGAAIGTEFSATFRIQGYNLIPGSTIIIQAIAGDNVMFNHLPEAFVVPEGGENGFTDSFEINPSVGDLTPDETFSFMVYAYPVDNLFNTVSTSYTVTVLDTL